MRDYHYYKKHPFQLLSDLGVKINVSDPWDATGIYWEAIKLGADFVVIYDLNFNGKNYFNRHVFNSKVISLYEVIRCASLGIIRQFLRPKV